MKIVVDRLEKYSSFNFDTQKMKIQMQLMNTNMRGIVNGKERPPTDTSNQIPVVAR